MKNQLKTSHDNSVEMWDKYYASKRGSPMFEKIVHYGRKIYFGDVFAQNVLKLGGQANSYLETGAGTGTTLKQIQQQTLARCVGIEKTPLAHSLGVQNAKNCEIILGDALALPLPDQSFDVAYSLGLFEHFSLEEQQQFLKEQARVSTKKILIEVPTKTPHMMIIMWFNRKIRGLKGVWADDELFTKQKFAQKFPGLEFNYHFDWASLAMTCWFVLDPQIVRDYFPKQTPLN